MATWGIKVGFNSNISHSIEFDESVTADYVAQTLIEKGIINREELCGDVHLLPENDGSVCLVDDSGFPYATLVKQRAPTLGEVTLAAAVSTPKCPTCGSTNLTKQGIAGRAVSSFLFGGLSPEGRAQWLCKNCGHMW